MIKHQRILNLLNEANVSKFVTRKLNIVNDYSKANYDVGNKIAFNTEVLKCILVINFGADIANDESFKIFKYKAKLLENAAANGADWILRNTTIAVPLKYLSNF